MKKSNSQFRYIFTFSIIIVLILVMMGGYLCLFYYRTILGDFKASNRSYLMAVMDRHESDMRQIDEIVLGMSLSSGALSEFKLSEAPLKSLTLKDRLYQYTSVSQFFQQLFFFYHGDNYLYNERTSVDVAHFLKKGLLLHNTDAVTFGDILYMEESGMQVLGQQGVSGYLVNLSAMQEAVIYVKPIEPYRKSTMLFLVGAPYYDKLLNSEEDLRQGIILYDDQIIVERGNLEIEEELFVSCVRTREKDQQIITLNHKKYMLTVQEGESGLVYCALQSMKVFQNKMFAGQWIILFMLLLSSIPASVGIIILSTNMFRHVRDISRLLDEDGEYGLENIESGIRTLVEINKEMERESLNLRRSRFISMFVRNEFPDRNAALAAAKQVGIEIDKPFYTLVLMGDDNSQNAIVVYELMQEYLTGRQLEDGYGIRLISSKRSLFVVWGNQEDDIKSLVEVFCGIGMDYCKNFIMSVSECHTNFAETANAFLEAETAYNYGIQAGSKRILYFSEVSMHKSNEQMTDNYIQQLKNVMREESDSELILEAINYMREHYHEPNFNMGALADYLDIRTVTLAVEFKNAMGINPSDYLTLIRIEQAKKLLKETNLKVHEISLKVGYEDSHVLIRRFKKFVGKTPGQFRAE